MSHQGFSQVREAKRRMITIPGLGLPHAGPVTKQRGQPQVPLPTFIAVFFDSKGLNMA